MRHSRQRRLDDASLGTRCNHGHLFTQHTQGLETSCPTFHSRPALYRPTNTFVLPVDSPSSDSQPKKWALLALLNFCGYRHWPNDPKSGTILRMIRVGLCTPMHQCVEKNQLLCPFYDALVISSQGPHSPVRPPTKCQACARLSAQKRDRIRHFEARPFL